MKEKILSVLKRKILVYDGAMGTELQKLGLKPGECPEEWNLLCPEKVLAVHKSYVSVGADIVETNTFGGNKLSLKKYGLENKCFDLNCQAVKTARKSGAFVAASVGPLPEMVAPLGKIKYEEAEDVFNDQLQALNEAKPDIILFETFSDINELRIAVIAAKEISSALIQAQLTFSEDGTAMGTTPEAAVVILESLGVDIIGANCSLGPRELYPIIEKIARTANSKTLISVLPNAGLPQIKDGKTVYPASPKEMAEYAEKFQKLGVNMIGGCCGTNPLHIGAIAKAVRGKKIVKRKNEERCLKIASRTTMLEFCQENVPYIIGERINPSRRKDLIDELGAKKSGAVRGEAEEQVKAGADLLDVNVSVPSIDEPVTMDWVIDAVQQTVKTPLVIDSSNIKALESGLKAYVGKAIVNSVSGEEKKLKEVLPLVKKYGAAVVALTLDDKGIPMTVAKRIAIAEKIFKRAEKLGISKENILVDFLTLTAGAQPESTEVTLSCIKEAKKRGWQTVLGVSNISFGLPNRPLVNSTFITMALREGLTAAIINPKDEKMRETISAYRTLFGLKTKVLGQKAEESKDPLYKCILTGDKDNVVGCVEKYLNEGKDPLEINQKILIPALEEVGVRFEKREYFLPQLLLSAEAMQKAMERLEKAFPNGSKKEGASVVMATVKGDLHDIGKNIVAAVLKNYGFNVIDLGRDVPVEKIIEAVKKEDAAIVGLSALMTTTMGQMEVVINELKKKGIDVPTIIGGAVVTDNYAKKIGAAGYAKDAVSAVKEIKRILKGEI